MTSPEDLTRVAPEFMPLLLSCTAQRAVPFESAWQDAGLVVRRVRGSRMRTYAGLFDEFAAALQFPWYFGHNRAAFDECVADLEWLPPGAGYVVVVGEPADVLADEPPDALAWLVSSLTDAAAAFASAVPFHVVLRAAEGIPATDRWTAAGARVLRLGPAGD